MTAARPRRRPFGVYAIIVLQLFTAVVFTMRAFDMAARREYAIVVDTLRARLETVLSEVILIPLGQPPLSLPALSGSPPVVGVDLAFALVLVVNVVGLWRLRRWAWMFTMIETGVSLLIGIGHYLQGTPNYPSLLVDVIIVFYLNQRDVQECFQGRRREAQA